MIKYLNCAVSLSLLLLGAVNSVKAQTASYLEAVETKLASYYDKMETFKSDYEQYDSLEWYSEQFDVLLFKTLKDDPSSIHYSFRKLQDLGVFWVVQSDDKKFRIYSWDTQTGGTMKFFNYIMQYETANGAKVERPVVEEGDPLGFYSKIYTLNRQNAVPVYLAISNSVYSSKDASQTVEAFAIEQNKLISEYKIFKTKSKTLGVISVPFDFFSVVDRPERPLELITFDKAAKKMYIPIVTEDGKVTKRNIVYQFDGTVMKHILTEKK